MMEKYRIPFGEYKDTLENIKLKRNFIYHEIEADITELIIDLSHNEDYMSELEEVCVRFNGEQMVEADEFYIVRDLLFGKLKKAGEMITEFKGIKIWGRVGIGLLEYDNVISQICDDSMILNRSKNESII